MGERNVDNADLAVEELKKKARRRLVGAIVLALAAAVILPLLLEKEPKPLGADVSVQIPPVDEGKFVNRLTGRGSDSKTSAKSAAQGDAKTEPKTESKPESEPDGAASGATTRPPAPAAAATSEPAATDGASAPAPGNVAPPKKSLAQAEQRVLSPATTTAGNAEVNSAAASKPDATAASPAPASPAATIAIAPPSAPPGASLPQPAPKTEPAVAIPAQGEGFAVQIAAFTDDKGANALVAKLKKAGFASTYVEPVQTSRGTLWRVRVGGYAVRADADAARAKLKADGWNGIVMAK